MSEKININDITRGAMAVILSQVLPKDEDGLTVVQAAEMLGISISSLNTMRHTKTGPQCYRENGKFLYSPSSVKAYMDAKNRRAA